MKRGDYEWLCAALALSVVWCWPLADVYWFDSHEAGHYVTRTVEYAAALARGELYPRWCPDFYAGYGSPFFNFYAPGVYWLGGALTALLDAPVLALKLVVLIASLSASAFAFAIIRLETGRSDAAFIGACLYISSPYRLAEVSWRGDLAELLALGMLPAAVYGYRWIVHEREPRRLPALTLAAALAHAALILSHTVIGLWGTGLLAGLLLASCFQLWRSGEARVTARFADLGRTRLLGLAFGGALLISCFYTGPALLEKTFVRTEVMFKDQFAPANNMLTFAHLFSAGAFHVGPLLLAALLALLAGAIYRRRLNKSALAWFIGGVLFLSLTLSFAKPLWAANLIPFGAYIQFPWRLLGPASLCLALAFGMAWAHLFPSRLVSGLLSMYVVIGAALLAMSQSSLAAMAADRVVLSTERIRSASTRGTILDEYLPRTVNGVEHQAGAPLAVGSDLLKVHIEESRGTRHVLRIDAREEAELELNLHGFPGWHARTLAGGQDVVLAETQRGLLSLRVPQPGRYRVVVEFGLTWVRGASLALSLVGLFSVWPLAFLLTRRARSTRSAADRQALLEHA